MMKCIMFHHSMMPLNSVKQETAEMTRINSIIILQPILFACFLTLNAASSASADVLESLEQCYDCHGPQGQSVTPEMPIIAGYSKSYILEAMSDYRHSDRPCHEARFVSGPNKGHTEDMCGIARKLSILETEMIAEHLSKQVFVPAKQKFDPEMARRGEKIHNRLCDKCHEEGGFSTSDDNGILAGQWSQYVRHQMEEFETGRRGIGKKMKRKFETLSTKDMEDLVQYYASQQQRDKK